MCSTRRIQDRYKRNPVHGKPISLTRNEPDLYKVVGGSFDLQIPIGRNGQAKQKGISMLYRIQCSSPSVD
jgi:hypothetical protein